MRIVSSWKERSATGYMSPPSSYGEAGIAVDRFDGTIVGQQLEEVTE